jgi:hypothetical protein
MWLVMLGLLLISAMGAESAPAPPDLCAAWEHRFQEPLSQSTVPEALHRILEAHQGHGLTSRFDETKQMKLLRRPLRATGQLVFIPGQGLYRQLQSPFEQELFITDGAIYQRQASGATETLSLAKLPAAKAFVEAFFAVFSGSWDTLHQYFYVYFARRKPGWQLGLRPLQATMANLISCLILDGEQERLVALHVQETNGDVTSDQFLEAQLLPESQWAAYRDRLNWPSME